MPSGGNTGNHELQSIALCQVCFFGQDQTGKSLPNVTEPHQGKRNLFHCKYLNNLLT
jgi:hypothetical protein